MFTLDPKGVGLLLRGQPLDVIWSLVTAFLGLTALAGGIENWFLKKTTLYERLALIAGGLILIYPIPIYDAVGILLFAGSVASQKFRKASS
jgi:TRAP-type uncharacterized transport system fused permease subunit